MARVVFVWQALYSVVSARCMASVVWQAVCGRHFILVAGAIFLVTSKPEDKDVVSYSLICPYL